MFRLVFEFLFSASMVSFVSEHTVVSIYISTYIFFLYFSFHFSFRLFDIFFSSNHSLIII